MANPRERKSADSRAYVSELIEETSDEGNFLATYADLVTLLFAFFVMLYGMSDTDVGKFDGAAASLRSALTGRAQRPARTAEREEMANAGEETTESADLDQLMKALQRQLTGDQIDLLRDGNRIRVRVGDRLLFRSGSADLSDQALDLFARFSKVMQGSSRVHVDIEGHTDDKPINTERFPSNWELSAIRATTVLRQLINSGIAAERLTATGFGDLMPLVENDSAEHRAKNRRVELVLEMEAQH